MSISQLEQEFEQLMETIGKQIQEKVDAAERLLGEACNLADEHGIPFESSISHLGQAYVPSNFRDKFGDLDEDKVQELTGVSSWSISENGGGGWTHSQVC